jgi:hypothetical protein
LCRKAIEIRRLHQRVAVAGEVAPAKIVSEDDDEIGLTSRISAVLSCNQLGSCHKPADEEKRGKTALPWHRWILERVKPRRNVYNRQLMPSSSLAIDVTDDLTAARQMQEWNRKKLEMGARF